MIRAVVFSLGDADGRTPRPALLEWLAEEGRRIAIGDPLFRYEVDKAVVEFNSPEHGFLRRHMIPEGGRMGPGETVALLSDIPDEFLPATPPYEYPNEDDYYGFDWSEIDNRAGPPQPLDVMRRAIADRMAMSKRHIPCFYLTTAIDMSGCIELRKSMKKRGEKATFNDMVIRAAALTLVENPKAAWVYTPDGLVPRTEINIGFAAALPDDGLVVPVVKNADRKTLPEIADETRTLAAKAKSGALTPGECSGGVFSVSYLGSYEVDNFIAIVNPGEAAIAAVGKTVETPVAVDGVVVVRPIAKITLSSDHRSIDGALAARFMGDMKRLLERPEKL